MKTGCAENILTIRYCLSSYAMSEPIFLTTTIVANWKCVKILRRSKRVPGMAIFA